ncbi:MAG: BamA/TamA family outer membrane protein [Bacteroidaceae bacterium]|nr:BamA/TamA family outer membrane protein [Bacteroidaceae bacterium]
MRKLFIFIPVSILLTACYTTKNLPENEVLYRGIKKLDYDAQPKRTPSQQEGVITALADAYNTVEGLLSGDASMLRSEEEDKDEVKDSLKKVDKIDAANYETAKEEIKAALAYSPNGAIMGSSYYTHPFPIRLWIYNKYVNSTSKFGHWMMNHFAATPVYVSSVNPKVRSAVAHNALRNYGYFRNKVTYDTIPLPNPKKAKISYHVMPGPVFHLDTIKYLPFYPQADSIIQATMNGSKLKQGEPFSTANLEAERNRLHKEFRNNGYFYYRPNYISFRADTLMIPQKVQLQITPLPETPTQAKHPYYLGNTRINIYKYNMFQLTDSMTFRGQKYAYSNTEQKPPLKLRAILPNLFLKKGELYQQRNNDVTLQKLSDMDVFSSVRVNYVPRDTTLNNDTLDVVVSAMLDKPFDAEFEGKVTNKSNNYVGPGLSFGMRKRNAFRGAETLGLNVWGSYEWQTGAHLEDKGSLINSFEIGTSASLTYPRLLFFGLGKKLWRRSISSTHFELNARWVNRARYFSRVSFGASVSYTLQRKKNIKHEFTPFSLTYDLMLSSTEKFDSITRANPALYVSMRDQFIPSMEYTFTWKKEKNRQQQTLKINVKEAGNVTSGIYAIFGKGFNQQGKELFGVPFAQFIKSSVQYTRQFPLTTRTCLATRFYAGIIYSYGNALTAPYNDLFSIGGANSIRAFAIRSIGPGSYHPAKSTYSYIDETGDIKLEANLEYRFPIIANLYGAAFIDAGNVWLIRENDKQPGGKINMSEFGKTIALGTGVGLRYDLDFLVIRFDLGIGIHAPYDTGKSGYYNMPSFGKSLGYHLAIGYPF